MNAAELIKERRLERLLTQRQVADAIGVDPYTVSRWERGQAPPNDLNRVRLARFFGGHPNDYVTYDEAVA
jgi:transcriptional regulator with XRE-family HTH domain